MVRVVFLLVLVGFIGGAGYLATQDIPVTQKQVVKTIKIVPVAE